ncbi:MAG: 4-hydroxythreonine-4-phosphate dehydrogenase PdxA [Desulfurivibrionaceae bacterium]
MIQSSPLAVTMGCPVGIGPEIILKYFSQTEAAERPPLIVIGDLNVLARCSDLLGIKVDLFPCKPGAEMPPEGIAVYTPPESPVLDPGSLSWGVPDRNTARAMAVFIEEAVRLAREGSIRGLVTCPISKAALRKAGYPYPGHTEMIAFLCSSSDYAMMMAGSRLRVTLVTIHTPLAEVPAELSRDKVSSLIELTGSSLFRDFGVASPVIAVAGLNPHAGEDDLFGREERLIIEPAVQEARKSGGWQVEGPLPADSLFYKAVQKGYDAVVCMYHDQGLIPFKMLHFTDGVNVTIGLPLVRTSVDHGTAYDIAGQGKADFTSLAAAVRTAAEIAEHRRQADKKTEAGNQERVTDDLSQERSC